MKLLTGKGVLLIAALLSLQQLSASIPAGIKLNSVDTIASRGGIPVPKPVPKPKPQPVPQPKPAPVPSHPAPGAAPGIENLPDVPLLGSGHGIGDVKPIADYEVKGKERLMAYENAVKQNREETKIVDDEAQVRNGESFFNIFKKVKYYEVTPDMFKRKEDFKEFSLFQKKDLGFDYSEFGLLRQITIKDETFTGPNKPIINMGTYSTEGRFIISEERYKAHDKTPPNSNQKTPMNEVTWQAFASIANDKGVSKTQNLKVIFMKDIQNKGFWSITGQNYKEAGIDTNKMVVWKPGDAAETARFHRFLGSDNINGMLLFLANHHRSAGNKKVAKVITIPKGVKGSRNKFTAALVLEET
ncbi:hypothetical protein F4818DRAFT_442633 [Hypoxylon cercidicola]|nr:hypothetical protein F4818DRAFT_442633 [Hypoxylon cercidicola]